MNPAELFIKDNEFLDTVKDLYFVWQGYNVFFAYNSRLMPSDPSMPAPPTGYPIYLLEKDGEVRQASIPDEVFAIMDALYPDEEGEETEDTEAA